MNPVARFLTREKSIFHILIIGTVIRLLFVFVLGKIYYGKPDFFFQNDTSLWFDAFTNLWEKGTFTTNIANEAGKFFRPPGYSFLFGIFYLITFKNLLLASKLLVAVQIVMDIASIYLVSKIAGQVVRNSSEEKKRLFSNVSGLLYAIYPFAVVWTPVLYAETPSVFFVLLSIYFMFKPTTGRTIFLSGMFAGIATLLRLQCAFCIPFIALGFLYSNEFFLKKKIKLSMLFLFGVLVTYGLWPARNIFLQHRVLFSQDLMNVGNVWSIDFLSFIKFSHSVTTDITPEYYQILGNKKVIWPKQAYLDPGDSILLDSVVQLCRTCGTGFSFWGVSEGIRKHPVLPAENCDTQIDKIFTSLYLKQKSNNAFNYWVNVPLGNLKKCFFKFSLYGNKSKFVKLVSSSLFLFRTLFIFFGLWGILLAIRKRFFNPGFIILVSFFMLTWYLYLSFFWRNIEIRFLLQCDILLLIPAAYLLMQLFFKKSDLTSTKG